MRSIFYGFIISILVAVVSSFPNGSGTCNSIQATIEGVANSPMGKLNTALNYGFNLNLKNNNYIPGGSAILTLNGTQPYNGILLYALDSQKNHVGAWTVTKGFKILNMSCAGDPEGTITHDSANPKPAGTQLTWTAPKTDVGPVTFVGTVVVNAATGFQIVKSQSFSVAGSNFTGPPASTNTAVNPQPTGGSAAPNPTSNPSIPTSDASSLMGGSLLLAKLGLVAAL
ncbi:876_t:CDS:2, partial [Cetraspora pellucida]